MLAARRQARRMVAAQPFRIVLTCEYRQLTTGRGCSLYVAPNRFERSRQSCAQRPFLEVPRVSAACEVATNDYFSDAVPEAVGGSVALGDGHRLAPRSDT
jgi:hypothetical protein